MDKNKHNTIDEVFKSKLYDFEMETNPGDWDVISDRLDKSKSSVYIKRYSHYWAIAGAICLLVTIGSIYLFSPTNVPQISHVENFEKNTEVVILPEVSTVQSASDNMASLPVYKKVYRSINKHITEEQTPKVEVLESNNLSNDQNLTEANNTEQYNEKASVDVIKKENLLAETSTYSSTPKKKSRKWGFGMGGGGLGTGSESVVNTLTFRNTYLQDDKMVAINSIANQSITSESSLSTNSLKTNINHKTPISFGLSVSRYLDNKFSLQTGLTYSMLNSEWEQKSAYHSKTKQRLHLIGLPISVTYKIAEWERFSFYGSAGVLTEINVAGELQTKSYTDDKPMNTTSDNIRMKEPLFSVNSRAGISYPLIKFVSAFTEVGASYYFDNGSKIETIHSEKPFNVSLQVGVRFGF